MNVCRVAENVLEAADHSIGPTQNLGLGVRWLESRVGLIQPSGEADTAGNRVQFRHAQAMFGKEQVRANDAGDIVFEGGRALQRDQFRRFAEVEPLRNPHRHFAFGALAIKEIDRAIELKQHPPKRFNLLCQIRSKREGLRRNPPFLTGKQSVRRKTVPDHTGLCGSLVIGDGGSDWHNSLRDHRRVIPAGRQK
jgi:hypothetical protein